MLWGPLTLIPEKPLLLRLTVYNHARIPKDSLVLQCKTPGTGEKNSSMSLRGAGLVQIKVARGIFTPPLQIRSPEHEYRTWAYLMDLHKITSDIFATVWAGLSQWSRKAGLHT